MEQRYQQLSEAERCEIWRLRSARGAPSGAHIGLVIGRDKSTISRELRRNLLPKSGHVPVSAQRMCLARRQRKRRSKIERSSLLLDAVHDGLLAMERTPEQIADSSQLSLTISFNCCVLQKIRTYKTGR
jgi:transposase, IS30 family